MAQALEFLFRLNFIFFWPKDESVGFSQYECSKTISS